MANVTNICHVTVIIMSTNVCYKCANGIKASSAKGLQGRLLMKMKSFLNVERKTPLNLKNPNKKCSILLCRRKGKTNNNDVHEDNNNNVHHNDDNANHDEPNNDAKGDHNYDDGAEVLSLPGHMEMTCKTLENYCKNGGHFTIRSEDKKKANIWQK